MGRKNGGIWVFFSRSHQNAISPIWEKTREKMRDKKFRLRETKLPRATFTFILSFSSFLTTRFSFLLSFSVTFYSFWLFICFFFPHPFWFFFFPNQFYFSSAVLDFCTLFYFLYNEIHIHTQFFNKNIICYSFYFLLI